MVRARGIMADCISSQKPLPMGSNRATWCVKGWLGDCTGRSHKRECPREPLLLFSGAGRDASLSGKTTRLLYPGVYCLEGVVTRELERPGCELVFLFSCDSSECHVFSVPYPGIIGQVSHVPG